MKLLHGLLLMFVLPSLLLAGPAAAAENGGLVTVFGQGPSPRALALGGAYTAVADDPGAMVWNPAGLGFIDRKMLAVSRTSYYSLDMTESFAGFALPSWKFGVLDFTFRHFGVGGIEGRSDRNQVSAVDLSNDETELALGYAKPFGEAWSLGGTVRYYRQSLAGFSGSTVGFDLGFLAYPGRMLDVSSPWAERVRVGASIRNLVDGTWTLDQVAVEERPTGRLGLAYEHPWTDQRLLVAFDVEGTRDGNPLIHAGVEFTYRSMIALRTGVSNSAFTVGAGMTWRDLGFQYTYEDNGLGGLHRMGLAFGFGATTEEAYHATLRKQQAEIEAHLAEEYSRRQSERTQALLEDAERARATGDLDGALQTLAVAATLAPEDPRIGELEMAVLFQKASFLEEGERFTDAALLYGRLQGMEATGTRASAGLARCQAEIARRAERTEALREMFASSLDAFSAGDLIAARRGFRRILAEEPADTEARAMLDRTDEAIARRSADLLDQARRFAAGGLVEPAEIALAQARSLDPSAGGLSAVSRDVAAARAKATTTAPDSTGSVEPTGPDVPATVPLSPERRREIADLYERGLLALDEGRAEDALRYWEIVYSADPDFMEVRERLKEEYLMVGMDAFAIGKLDAAIGFWERALLLDPDDDRTQGYLVRARQQLARTREILGEAGGVRGQ
jgi:tetratricopeptide (TPR) repeat protein